MGLLKNRWSSLRGLRLQFRNKDDLKSINNWIRFFIVDSQNRCCLILHNVMKFVNDVWEDEEGVDQLDLDPSISESVNDNAHSFREWVKGQVANFYSDY